MAPSPRTKFIANKARKRVGLKRKRVSLAHRIRNYCIGKGSTGAIFNPATGRSACFKRGRKTRKGRACGQGALFIGKRKGIYYYSSSGRNAYCGGERRPRAIGPFKKRTILRLG